MSYRIPNTNWLTAFLVLSHFGCTADPPEGRRAASEAVAESDPLSHVFTYSILETDPTRGAVLESLEALGDPDPCGGRGHSVFRLAPGRDLGS